MNPSETDRPTGQSLVGVQQSGGGWSPDQPDPLPLNATTNSITFSGALVWAKLVIVAGKSLDVPPATLNSILKQAGLKR